jgi:signal transduction histidine kinase
MSRERIDPVEQEERKTDTKTSKRVTGKKRFLALILVASLVIQAAIVGKVVILATTTLADVVIEDWIEQNSYEESVTLATRVQWDLYDVLRYIQLKQLLEESDGTVRLDRIVLVARMEDDTIQMYTMQDMIDLGENMGINVYEMDSDQGMTESRNDILTEHGEMIQDILWSVFDYGSDSLGEKTLDFDYWEDPWNARYEEIDLSFATIEGKEEGSQIYVYDKEDSEISSSEDAQISLSEYARYFLVNDLENYYLYKEEFTDETSSFHWYLQLEKDGVCLEYGDPATLRGEVTIDDLEANCQYDSSTRTITDSFNDQVEMAGWSTVKSRQIYNYDSLFFYVGVDTREPESYTDIYSQECLNYRLYKPKLVSDAICLAAALGIFLIAWFWLTALAGHRDREREIHLNWYDRLPTEIGLAGVVVLIVLGVMDVYLIGRTTVILYLYDNNVSWYHITLAGGLAGFVILCSLALWLGWYGLVKRIKAHTLWKNSLVRRICSLCIRVVVAIYRWGQRWIHRTSKLIETMGDAWWKTLGAYGGYLLVNGILISMGIRSGEFFLVLLILFNGGVAVFLFRKMAQRKQVQKGIEQIASGNVNYQLPLDGLTGDAYVMAAAINSIRDGLNNAIETSVKNERMRTELITNVSHDIKTPLTSIINYVDLLKRENIEDPKVQEYLDILEKKAERLKVLTEDLVEASKASSGAIKLNEEEIDFVELVNQTNGEFTDGFAKCDLHLICTIPEEPAYILADGRYVWRILENLYRNVEKYAMPGTRVYVEVARKGNRICFVMKNISARELNIPAEELTERFIRGDASRTSEGSGLGLSIAKDLTTLMQGTFQIYLDGDLFRVTVSFPVCQ